MNEEKDRQLDREEELHAENNVLRLKLGLEHGMQMNGDLPLPPNVENQWLKHVYAYEQQYRHAKQVSVYDYVGRPEYKKWDTLDAEQTSRELARIESIMAQKDVHLDSIGVYDDATIYKFITEELFAEQMDDVHIPGMLTHYTYEEFHPNHDYDLKRRTSDFIENIFEKEWTPMFNEMVLAQDVLFSEKLYKRDDISAIIIVFQEAHTKLEIDHLDITEVAIDDAITQANVRIALTVSGTTKSNEPVTYQGNCFFHCILDDGYWCIDAFRIPGL